MESSSSSSISTRKRCYVYLSFDRVDVNCRNFVSHLYGALMNQGISVYRDNVVHQENTMDDGVFKIIKESEISVVIFSEGFASSRQCVEELVTIMELWRKNKYDVVLVYYGLDPSKYVAHPSDYFTEAIRKLGSLHGGDEKKKLERWTDAFDSAAKLPGWDSRQLRDEVTLMEEVVWRIWEKVDTNPDPDSTSQISTRNKCDVYLSYRNPFEHDNSNDDQFMKCLFKSILGGSGSSLWYGEKVMTQIEVRAVEFAHTLLRFLRMNGISCYSSDVHQMGSLMERKQEAMEESRICVVILTYGFASSWCCLDELVKIMELWETKQRVVLPVYYGLERSYGLPNLNDYFEKAFNLPVMQKEDQNRVHRWRKASLLASQLFGWHSKYMGSGEVLLESIAMHILERLGRHLPFHFRDLELGALFYSQLRKISTMLKMELSDDVRIVGILGEDGMGKTTIAKALLDSPKIKTEFDKFYYIKNVNVGLKTDVLNHLRNKLRLESPSEEESLDKGGLAFKQDPANLHQKVLLVLDDATHVEELITDQKRNFFGPGSRILFIMSKKNSAIENNLQLLDAVHEVKGIDEFHSDVLFWANVLIKSPFDELDHSGILKHTEGNPLAVRIIGSAFNKKSESEWASAAGQLRKYPIGVEGVVRWSYDTLKEEEKKLFLDIACFFVDEKWDCATKILHAHYSSIRLIFRTLLNRSLIGISDGGKLEVHKLLQEMAWRIVREEFRTNGGKRSKLWDPENLHNLLTRQKKWMMLDCSSSFCLISR